MTDNIRGVHVILFKGKQVLLLKRNANAPTNPNLWSLPGGTMEKGDEDYITRLKKELSEEVFGIHPRTLPRYYIIRIKDTEDSIIVYCGEVSAVKDIGFNSIESDGMAFFTRDEWKKLNICPEHLEAIEKWYEEHR